MELEFDKEIDALLRKGLSGRSPTGDALAPHLDADELSAFAENVLPAKTRAFHMTHIADCDRCRRILSNLVMLNAEAEPQRLEAAVAAPVIAPAIAEPWYRRLMLFPNLAYVMGGLVLVFGGMITFSLLQTANSGREASISQATEQMPAARGPMAPSEPDFQSSANTSANASSSVANTNSASLMPESASNKIAVASNSSNASMAPSGGVPAKEELAKSADVPYVADSDKKASPPPPPAAVTQPMPSSKDDMSVDGIVAESRAEKESDERKRSAADLKLKQSPRRDSGGSAKPAPGPEMGRQVYPNQSSNTFELPTRRISGKGFSRKNNVWYDDSYSGQATTNVRRNTEDYRKLDRGLRTIAESLDGVVVVVWTGKAYRIQ